MAFEQDSSLAKQLLIFLPFHTHIHRDTRAKTNDTPGHKIMHIPWSYTPSFRGIVNFSRPRGLPFPCIPPFILGQTFPASFPYVPSPIPSSEPGEFRIVTYNDITEDADVIRVDSRQRRLRRLSRDDQKEFPGQRIKQLRNAGLGPSCSSFRDRHRNLRLYRPTSNGS